MSILCADYRRSVGWISLWPEIEDALGKAVADRLKREQRYAEETRASVVRDLYTEHLDTLSAFERTLCPQERYVIRAAPFLKLIEQLKTVSVTKEDFALPMADIAAITSRWMNEDNPQLDRMDDRIPNGFFPGYPPQTPNALRRSQLATAVFISNDKNAKRRTLIVGLHGAVTAGSFSYFTTFSELGSRVVLSLLNIMNMDPWTTTPYNIDSSGRLFSCLHCEASKRKPLLMTWRLLVNPSSSSQL